jgi:hypothetical protein
MLGQTILTAACATLENLDKEGIETIQQAFEAM